MSFLLLQQLSLAGDLGIVVPWGATYTCRKFAGEVFLSFPLEKEMVSCKRGLKAKHFIFLLSSWQHAEDQLCATIFSPPSEKAEISRRWIVIHCWLPVLSGFLSPLKTANRKVITGADVTCDVNVTSGLFFLFFFFIYFFFFSNPVG